jgi:hypothetical protein
MSSDPAVLALLGSIDTTLKALLAVSKVGGGAAPTPAAGAAAAAPQGAAPQPEAADYDLNGKYGDPEIRAKDPRDWVGPPQQGKHFSECPADYLIMVAERLEYFAGQNETSTDPDVAKKAKYNRLDASRARGWAKRIRGDVAAPARAATTTTDPSFGTDPADDTPPPPF